MLVQRPGWGIGVCGLCSVLACVGGLAFVVRAFGGFLLAYAFLTIASLCKKTRDLRNDTCSTLTSAETTRRAPQHTATRLQHPPPGVVVRFMCSGLVEGLLYSVRAALLHTLACRFSPYPPVGT